MVLSFPMHSPFQDKKHNLTDMESALSLATACHHAIDPVLAVGFCGILGRRSEECISQLDDNSLGGFLGGM